MKNSDIKIDHFRESFDSSFTVRITHIPTKVVAECGIYPIYDMNLSLCMKAICEYVIKGKSYWEELDEKYKDQGVKISHP